MPDIPATRWFAVHGRDEDRHHARRVLARGFKAAAVAWLEDADFAEPQISVVVRDVDGGHERCFRIDVASGETSACG